MKSLFALLALFWPAAFAAAAITNDFVAGEFHQLNNNGAWSWFMDERAIVDNNLLLVGSVRATGRFPQKDLPGWGNVELTIFNLTNNTTRTIVLHEHFEQDDHNAPSLLKLANGRFLAAYSKHGQETKFYVRRSEPNDPYAWGPVIEVATPGSGGSFRGDNVTYANLFQMPEGRIYMFHRGVGLDPNYLISDDSGETWRYGGHLLIGRDGYSPYLKYAFNGRDTIHFVATEDHPRNYDNSLFHGFVRGGNVYSSDAHLMGPLSTTTNTSLHAWDFTKVFQGSPTNVAWMCDMHLDASGNPVVLFTTQRDGAGLPQGQGGMDHRFNFGQWNGSAWITHEIAYAGTRLYPGEDDYTGLGAIDPQNPKIVYISTDADPRNGKPLISKGTSRRFHELFRGSASDNGANWNWTPITANSSTDNVRPIVPMWKDPAGRTLLLWMRGAYLNNRGEWTTAIVATILSPT